MADAVSVPAEEFVKQAVMARQLVMFTKKGDPFCRLAKEIFAQYKMVPGVLLELEIDRRQDVTQVENYLAFVCKSADFNREVPRLFIGGRYFGGWKEIYRGHDSGDLEFALQQGRALVEE